MQKDPRLVRMLKLADEDIKKTDKLMVERIRTWIFEQASPEQEYANTFFADLRTSAVRLREYRQAGDTVPAVSRETTACFSVGQIPGPHERKTDERKLTIACAMINEISGLKAEVLNNLLRVHWEW